MTYNNTTGTIEHGACPYIGHYNTMHTDGIFYTMEREMAGSGGGGVTGRDMDWV